MVSAQGFEPRTHALEGRCSIQLSYAPIFYYGAGNEIRTRDFHLGKVTLYHWTIPAYTMAGITGLEPVTHWLTVNCSTNWAIFPRYLIKLATWKGLEPSTSSVTGWHSNQLNYQAANGGTNRARTCDPLLVRQVLSQLSYSPISLIWSGWRGSNPHSRLGRPELYHWATPAYLIGDP